MKYRWRYGITNKLTETIMNVVGIGATDVTHSETTSVYVSTTEGDDTTGDGTYEKPWATIQHAIDNIGSYTQITILDSGIYYANEIANNYITLDGITLQAAVGTNPTLTIDTSKGYSTCMVYVINDGKLDNITIQGQNIDDDVVGIIIDYGTVKNCNITDTNYIGVLVYDGQIENSKVYEISGTGETYGIKIEEVTGSEIAITDCLVHNAGMYGIYCGASAPTISHCTIADNLFGIDGSGAMEINDCIIYNNRIYDVCCPNAIYGMNCIGKTLYNVGSNVLRLNPLLTADYKLTYIPDSPDIVGIISPCIDIASDNRDLGCYEVTRIVNKTITGTFETERPTTRIIRKEPINANSYVTYGLKKVNYADGFIDILYLAWPDKYVLTDVEAQYLQLVYETNGYIQLDEGEGYETYIINKNNRFAIVKALNIEDNTYYMNIELELIKV